MASLAELYDSHALALHAFALELTRSEADAADLLQEVFCQIAERPALLKKVKDPRAFLLRMIYSRFVDGTRRLAVRRKFAEEKPSILLFAEPEDPDEAEFRASLAHALGELPADQRAVVHLKLWTGLTFEQIAEALAIPANTAASRYRYGIDKLRTLLRPLYEEIR